MLPIPDVALGINLGFQRIKQVQVIEEVQGHQGQFIYSLVESFVPVIYLFRNDPNVNLLVDGVVKVTTTNTFTSEVVIVIRKVQVVWNYSRAN
ncbi:MAG: hypothetical protein P0S95_00710 [Rhabdochlamydiaceae bacterium]|nr:hypothetical protein [Candidatus Amphrikana amoebophyrae]